MPNLCLHLFGLLIKLDIRPGGKIYTIMQNFVKSGHEISRFFDFKMAAVCNLGFSDFQIFGRQTS